jgi:hypothetical protein
MNVKWMLLIGLFSVMFILTLLLTAGFDLAGSAELPAPVQALPIAAR